MALVCDVYCDFVTFPFVILGQVWYLIVLIPDPCCLSYFDISCELSCELSASKRTKNGFQDLLWLNAGQKYSAILPTFIKLAFVIKTFVLSIFEWPFTQVLLYYNYKILCVKGELLPFKPQYPISKMNMHYYIKNMCHMLLTYVFQSTHTHASTKQYTCC